MHGFRVSSAVIAFGLLTAWVSAGDVPGWRGDGTGHYPNAQPPKVWSDESQVIWKTELPSRSYSSPVLVAGKLFLLAEPSKILCVDAKSGEILWEKSAGYAEALGEDQAKKIAETHQNFDQERKELNEKIKDLRKENPEDPKIEPLKEKLRVVDTARREYARQFPQEKRGGAGNSAATPVWHGGHVFACFGTGIVGAFTPMGERVWTKRIEAPQQGFGHSSSPVIADDKLIIHIRDLVALDPKTGNELWRTETQAKYGSPIVAQIGGQDVVITPAGTIVQADTGDVLTEKLFNLSNNSPLVQEGIVYAHESGKIRAFRLPKSTEEPFEPELLWDTPGTRDQRMSSAVLHDGRLYAGTRRGMLDVIDAQTGKMLYRKRLSLGEIYASASAAGGLIFLGGRDGKTLVLNPGEDFDEVSTNETDRYASNPVFEGNRMYLRSNKFLYCIGE